MNTVTRIIKKVSSSEKFPESSLPPYKPIAKLSVPKLQRVSSLPRIEVDRARPSPLYRSASAPLSNSTLGYPPVQGLVLHNENYENNKNDRSQKLLLNTKKVRGLRSFLWIKPRSSSTQALFVSQLLPSLAVNLSCLSIGLALGFSSIFLPWRVKEDMSDDVIEKLFLTNITTPNVREACHELGSWIASIFWLGAFLGGLLGRWLSPQFGNRVSIILLSIPDVIGWILLASPPSTPLLMIGRFLTGVAAGGYFPNVYSYVREISSVEHRHLLSLLPLPATGLGVLLIYSLSLVLLPDQVALLCAALPTVLAIALTFTDDSPIWLLTMDKNQEAVSAVGKLRGGDTTQAVSEILQIQQKRKKQAEPLDIQEGVLTIYRKHMDTFATINTIFFFMAFSGIFSIDFYSMQLMQEAGGEYYKQLSAVMIAFMYVIGCIIFIILGKRFSRKSLYIFSSTVSGVFLTLFGLSVYHYNHYVRPSTIVPLFSLSLFMLSAPLGLSSLPFTLLAESFPPEVRPLASCLTLSLASLQLFLAIKLHVTLQAYAGLHVVIWLQAAICFLAAIMSLHLLLENHKPKMESLDHCDKFAGLRRDRNRPWVIPIH